MDNNGVKNKTKRKVWIHLICFAIFCLAYITVKSDIKVSVLGLYGYFYYFLWLMTFFKTIRPRLARILGTKLGIEVHEGVRGHWIPVINTFRRKGTGCGTRVLIVLADLVVLLSAVLGPLFAGLALLMLIS